MKVAIFPLGTAHYAFRAMRRELGGEMVEAPSTSHRTLTLGTRYSPEGVCIPFKLILGNFIESLEGGADTLVMATSFGPCRMGYYARIQERILRELGYRFEMITFGGPEGILAPARRIFAGRSTARILLSLGFGLAKLEAIDALEDAARRARAVEREPGSASRLLHKGVAAVDAAADCASLKRAKREYLAQFEALPRRDAAPRLRIAILGELYVVMEPFPNMEIETELGKMGVEVRRAQSWWWWLKGDRRLPFLSRPDDKRALRRAAAPYLRDDIGGEAWETIGGKVLYSRMGYDGLIHLLPFTCMPEIVAQNILPSTKEQLPVLTILCDEQTGKPGMLTRLEAFVDLLWQRQRKARKGEVTRYEPVPRH